MKYDIFLRQLLICLALLFYPVLFAAEPVCARVKIEIEQELTFEREAFEARMTIRNGLAGVNLADLTVDVLFFDDKGKPVIASSDTNFDPDSPSAPKFFIKLQSDSSIPASIPGESAATIRWMIIPAASAGGDVPQGKLYQVGAKLSYRLNGAGEPEVVEVSPDFIYVKPQPRLSLEYFLPREVNGDDPFTIPIEDPVPFSLGVRIDNFGFGPAKNLKIDSGQPKITENKQGLLVNFTIKGCEVNGAPVQPTLLANFGTVDAGGRSTARWMMECSLYGTFIDFVASFTHSDEVGGQLTSLIRQPIKTRLMVADVLVDLPGRDSIRDFLAYENHVVTDTAATGSLYVYESDRGVPDALVSDVSLSSTLSGAGLIYTLQAPVPTTGLLYIKKIDPRNGGSAIRNVVRADGYSLPATNYWLSKTYDKVAKSYRHYINLFDASTPSGQGYTLTYGAANSANHPPIFNGLPTRIVPAGSLVATTVQAFDPDGTQVELHLDHPPVGMTLDFASYRDGYTLYQLNWRPLNSGNYIVPVLASDGEFTVSTVARIVVTDGSTQLYDAWKSRYGITDDNGDPDRDGLNNRLEYALDTDPLTPDRRQHLSFDVVEVAGKAYVAVTFEMRTDDSHLHVVVEGADSPRDTAAWTLQTTELSQDQAGVPSHLRRVQVRDSVPLERGTAIRRFLRLKASIE